MAESNRSIEAKDQPITRHPLFPAVVALWCGAIAGLASVMISSATIEGVVVSLGIGKIVPMAAPPLGTTMRIVLALAMTGIGAAIGALIARRIVRSAATSEPTTAIAAEDASAVALRRRPLAVVRPDAPLVDEDAPLPGQATETPILNVADFDIGSFDENTQGPALDRDQDKWLHSPIGSEQASDEDDIAAPAWLNAAPAWRQDADTRGASQQGPQVFQSELDAAEQAARDEEVEEAPIGSRLFEAYSRELSPRSTEAEESAKDAEQAGPGFTLLPRLSRRAWSAENDQEAEQTAFTQQGTPFAAPMIGDAEAEDREQSTIVTSLPDAIDSDADYRPATHAMLHKVGSRIADAELSSLSQIELVERLALAMERRREEARRRAEEQSLTVTAPPFAAPIVPAADDQAESIDESAGQAMWTPDVVDDAHLAEVTDAPAPDDHAPQSLLGTIPFPTSPFPSNRFNTQPEMVEGEDEDDTVMREGYSSLLNLSRTGAVRKPVLRFSEPDTAGDDFAHASPPAAAPVPLASDAPGDPDGQAPEDMPEANTHRAFDAPQKDDPDATEKALRAALATLQRMSGAA